MNSVLRKCLIVFFMLPLLTSATGLILALLTDRGLDAIVNLAVFAISALAILIGLVSKDKSQTKLKGVEDQ